MDIKPFFDLTYGVFVLSTKLENIINGCIINTCIQVANNPARIAISVLNSGYTCELIKQSNVFNLGTLNKDCSFETIKHFGFQSGKDVNKFKNMSFLKDSNGVPYITRHTCSVISGKVIDQIDLDTHTLFIAEVTETISLNNVAPLTYADYHKYLKPQPENIGTDKNIVGWRCKICNYVYEGSELPVDYICPLCGHGPDDFEPIYES